MRRPLLFLIVMFMLLGAPASFGQTTTAADYFNRGVERYEAGDLDGAIADFTKAIELDPKLGVVAYSSRGSVKWNKNDLDGAIADYTKAIELSPKYADLYCGRGLVKSSKNDLDGAIADFTKAIELDPYFSKAYIGRSWIFLYVNKGDKAYTDALKANELSMENDGSYYQYAILVGYFGLRQSSKEEAADAFLTKWVKIVPASAWTTQIMHYLLKEITEQQLLTLADDNDKKTRAHAYIGLNQSLLGNRQSALQHLRWVRDNGNRSFNEYDLAANEIKRLESAAGTVLNGKAKNLVAPPYPAEARKQNVSGQVIVQVTIDENGNVISSAATKGPALLRSVSEDAARESKFFPTLISGHPVKVTGLIVYDFLPASVQPQTQQQQLQQMVAQLRGMEMGPNAEDLRHKLRVFAAKMSPTPTIPPDAVQAKARAGAACNRADLLMQKTDLLSLSKGHYEYEKCAREYEKAVAAAPWVKDYYFQLWQVYKTVGNKADSQLNLERWADSVEKR